MHSARIERIGLTGTTLQNRGADAADQQSRTLASGDHATATLTLLDWLSARVAGGSPLAVGHRVVHGGPDFSAPHRITPELLAKLKVLNELDPEHLPLELRIIDAMRERYPAVAQVACFDTAFHHDLPRVARLLPIPRRYEASGIRRYGFHGLSYEFLLGELARLNRGEAANGRLVLAHLGNGSSMAAVQHGKSIDTTITWHAPRG